MNLVTPSKDKIDSLRTGFTTGACSAAAARAALRMLCQTSASPVPPPLKSIEITLPNRTLTTFNLKQCRIDGKQAICSVIKDAGDDPDCTDKAELIAKVRFIEGNEIILKGGKGVAMVTKPGLGLEVGTSAINPVPRSNITAMLKEELTVQNKAISTGLEVIIEVPGGEEMSKYTTNARLGLVGGISILGTSGIVKPFSTAAYKRSIIQSIDVAYERKHVHLIFTTGGKSETYAMKHNPHLEEDAFIQVGDFMGIALRHAKRKQIRQVSIFGMIGKLSKMATGVVQTHQAGSQVNFQFLATLALKLGANDIIIEEIKNAITARGVLEICQKEPPLSQKLSTAICNNVALVMYNHALGKSKKDLLQPFAPSDLENLQQPVPFFLQVCMTDFQEGKIIAQSHRHFENLKVK